MACHPGCCMVRFLSVLPIRLILDQSEGLAQAILNPLADSEGAQSTDLHQMDVAVDQQLVILEQGFQLATITTA